MIVNIVDAAEALLRAGKSLCLVGPPGSGKTSLAKELAKARGYEFEFVTGREGLSYTTLMDLKEGPLALSVIRTWARYVCRETPVWFIFDEVNRAQVEVVLGEVFTLLDIDHRVDFRLLKPGQEVASRLNEMINMECGGGIDEKDKLVEHARTRGLPIPLSWRMIATMNLFDMTHLYRVGYAFARRAPLLPVTGYKHEAVLNTNDDEPRFREYCLEALRRMFVTLTEAIRKPPWSLLPADVVAMHEAPLAPLNYKVIAERVVARSPVWAAINKVVSKLEELQLLIGPGIYADACRIIASNLSRPPELLADAIISTLIAPQLTYVVPRARLELAMGRTTIIQRLQELADTISSLLGDRSLSAWAFRAYLAQVLPLG